MRLIKFGRDLFVTLTLWGYYTIGFVLFFSPFYIAAFFLAKNRTRAFQTLNHYFYRSFFRLLKILVPGCKWRVSDAVRQIRSAVVVANHISYLDPILLISVFRRHTTIAKGALFNIPLYGRVLALSGYIPSTGEGRLLDIKMDLMEKMPEYLRKDGVFFVFPEGTRSRNGRIGALNKGAFKVARMSNSSLNVVYIKNTDKLFKPGTFLFDTGARHTVTVELLDTIYPDDADRSVSVKRMMTRVHDLLEAGNQSL